MKDFVIWAEKLGHKRIADETDTVRWLANELRKEVYSMVPDAVLRTDAGTYDDWKVTSLKQIRKYFQLQTNPGPIYLNWRSTLCQECGGEIFEE